MLCVECIVKECKWVFSFCYKPPPSDSVFSQEMSDALDKMYGHYSNVCVIGDLNFDMSEEKDSNALHGIMNSYDLGDFPQREPFLPT